jgi:hypothetical protein
MDCVCALAKLYLNAEVYTGTKRYDDCIAACDKVIATGKYSIEPRASYLQMFYPRMDTNERVYLCDSVQSNDDKQLPIRSVNIHARYQVPRSMAKRFSMPYTQQVLTHLPEYYAYFQRC